MPIKQKVKAQGIILRPNISIADVRGAVPGLNDFLSNYKAEAVEQAEINLKYAGYMAKEQEMVDKMSRLEMLKLSESFAYHSLTSLSAEAREKLTRMKPMTIGQASRISGVSPADISVLLIHLGR
jgi:tRNA uridine 5-carboxymethylaminomethyl modification enzyme